MAALTRYDATTRRDFDSTTRLVLDLLADKYPAVEIEGPNERDENSKWFVQVMHENGNMPTGFFGSTIEEAARRLASALKLN